MQELKDLIKESSPFGKFTTNQSIYKAWSCAMLFALKANGIDKKQALELMSDSKFGFDKKSLERSCDQIYEQIKNPCSDQMNQASRLSVEAKG